MLPNSDTTGSLEVPYELSVMLPPDGQTRTHPLYNSVGLSLETKTKNERITEVPSLCPILDTYSYGAMGRGEVFG